MNLELTPDERKFIIDSLLDRAWQHQIATIEELTLISVPRFAGMVDLSTPHARRVLEETIDFGPQNTRVSLAEARRCVESRRVKKRR
jgi:hypothetical protein